MAGEDCVHTAPEMIVSFRVEMGYLAEAESGEGRILWTVDNPFVASGESKSTAWFGSEVSL